MTRSLCRIFGPGTFGQYLFYLFYPFGAIPRGKAIIQKFWKTRGRFSGGKLPRARASQVGEQLNIVPCPAIDIGSIVTARVVARGTAATAVKNPMTSWENLGRRPRLLNYRGCAATFLTSSKRGILSIRIVHTHCLYQKYVLKRTVVDQ